MARVESAPGTPGDRYREAALTLRRWREEGVLRRDASPSYYVYEQRFRAGGATATRRGLFARLRLREPGEGEGADRVLPHEATMAGPRAERLALLEATGTHVSPIFGIFEDDEGGERRPGARRGGRLRTRLRRAPTPSGTGTGSGC